MTRRDALALLGAAAAAGALPACSREPDPQPTVQAPETPASRPLPDDLHYLGLREVAALIAAGEISPLQLTQHLLDRISTLDGRLKS